MEIDHPQSKDHGNVSTNNELRCTIALAALESVVDPEIGLNVVDLGLIYRIDFNASGITLTMTLTTRHCPMGDAITNAVEQVMGEIFSAAPTVVELVFDPPWNATRISAAGKEFLNR